MLKEVFKKKTTKWFLWGRKLVEIKLNHINSRLVVRRISTVFHYISFNSLPFISVHCPYDTESILMIALTSILILAAAISLSGVIESSQLLCCAVSVSFMANYYNMTSSVSGQDEPNPALWLATRAGKMTLSRPLGIIHCVPQENNVLFPHNKSFIDQGCSGQDGSTLPYWPRYRLVNTPRSRFKIFPRS